MERFFQLIRLTRRDFKRYQVKSEPVFFSGSFTSEGSLLIGTQENLLVCNLVKDSLQLLRTIDGFDSYPVTSIHKTGDGRSVYYRN